MSFCGCGCGATTKLARQSTTALGHVRGQPVRFVVGHNMKGRQTLTDYARQHVGGDRSRRVHRVRVEQVLGRVLPRSVVIHHADGTRGLTSTLVVCPNQAYHKLLHARMRVVVAGGNPNTESICAHCRTVKPRAAFSAHPKAALRVASWCRACSHQRASGE